MMSIFRRIIPLLLLSLLTVISWQASAQTEPQSCPSLVERALTEVGDNCGGLERNFACYGFNRVASAFTTEVTEDTFSQPADRTELTTLRTLSTSPMILESGIWGIALMNVQANVPNTLPGQAVTFIVMGDTQVENRVAPEEALLAGDPVPVTVTSNVNRVNIRSGPGTNFNVVGTTSNGTSLDADGINEAGDWVRVSFNGAPAWISRDLVGATSPAALDALPVTSGETLSPMQSFYFQSGIGNPECEQAPDALVVQGPQEYTVNLMVNGVDVAIGSTIVLTGVNPEATPSVGNVQDFESPFGADAPVLLIDRGFYIYPTGPDSYILTGGAAGEQGWAVPLGEGAFLNPLDAQTLRLTASLDEQTGLEINGGVFVNPAGGMNTGIPLPGELDGVEGSGRLFIVPWSDDQVLVSFESGDIDLGHLADLLLPAMSPAAPDGMAPGCRTTELIVLDGEAHLNDGTMRLPLGHWARSETCFGPDGNVTQHSEWENLGIAPPDVLQRYRVLTFFPPNLLRYPITLPSEEDIQRALATPTPTPRPAAPQPQQPPDQASGLGVDCSNFVGTSPTDGLAFGPQTFYWNLAPGADVYRVIVQATDRPGEIISQTGAPANNLTIDLGMGAVEQFGRGLNFQWKAQAWANDASGQLQLACDSAWRAIQRQYISPEEYCRLAGGSWDGACYVRQGTIPIPD